MTDRIRHLTVMLDHDMRDDDIRIVVDAIRMIRFVANVQLGAHVNVDDLMAREAVRSEVAAKLHDAIDEVFHPERKTKS